MNKHASWFLIVALLLGWAFDFLFWDKPLGLNFAVFLTCALVGGFLLLLTGGCKPARASLWLLAPFAFFAAMSFMRKEPLTLWLAWGFALVSVGLLAVTYLSGRWPLYGLVDYLRKSFLLLFDMLILPADFYYQVGKERVESGKTFLVKPVLRGVAIAFPVVAGFTFLLSSADLVFNQKVIDLLDIFDDGKFGEYALRLAISLAVAYLVGGVVLHAATHSQDGKLFSEAGPNGLRFLGFTEAAIVLGSVAALFMLFVIIQFRYFFGGEVNIGVEGFTYSQYARRGFNELVTVGLMSLVLTLGLSTFTRRETEVERRTYSGLSVALLALVLVMLFSAYQRLSLAIAWHGYSRLRLYPSTFLIWVGILFVAVVALEITRRERFFAFAALLASAGFAVSLSLMNVDATIVRYNVDRAVLGWHFNVNYLTSLSTDAIPALANELADTTLPRDIREAVGAALLCYQHTETITDDPDWRSLNLSEQRAVEALKRAEPLLKNYQVNDEMYRYIVRVGTPHNLWYDCVVDRVE